MLRRFAPFVALLLLVAWGPEGHDVLGKIAQDILTDDAEKAVQDLLGDRTLAEVANWADDVPFTDTLPYNENVGVQFCTSPTPNHSGASSHAKETKC
jgi:hypothetical protein